MNEELIKTIQNIETNISRCDILNSLLEDIKNNGRSINYHGFYNKGYNTNEICLGVKLIDLYLMLKKYAE